MINLTKEWQNVASGSYSNNGAAVYFYLDAKYSEQQIDSNKTTIQTRLNTVFSGNEMSTYGYKFSCDYAPTVESNNAIWHFENETITSGSGVVNHNPDGKKTLTLHAGAESGGLGIYVYIQGDVALPTIPRASSVSATNAEIGKSSVIVINKASNNFTSTLRYLFKDLSGIITEKTELQNYGWEIPDSFYEKMATQNEECTIYCDTYNGNSLLGTKSTKIMVSTGADGLPVFDMTNTSLLDINSVTTALTGNNQKMILNYSNGKLMGKAIFRKYANPSFVSLDIATEVPFTIVEETDENTTISFEYTFEKFDCQNHQISVVDDRDGMVSLEIKDIDALPKYPSNETINFSTVNYVPLSVDLNAFRPDPKVSGEIRINFSGDCWNLNFGSVQNEIALNVKYRENSYEEKEWIDLKSLVKDTDYQFDESNLKISSINNISLGDIFDYTKKYDIGLFFEDKLVSSSGIRQVLRAKPIFWWNKDGVYDGDDNPLGGSIKIERWN